MKRAQSQNTTSHALNNIYKCNKCHDTGFIEYDGVWRRCECYELDYAKRLWSNYGVNPKDIKMLKEYEPYNDITRQARDKAIDYIKSFNDIEKHRENNFVLWGRVEQEKHIL